MIQPLGPFPGEWCDCDYSPADGGFVFAALERPGVVSLYRHADRPVNRELDTYALGRWALYLRCAADGAGNICVVLQDGRDPPIFPAIVVLFPKDGPPREIACPAGPAFGQNAVEIEGQDDGWFVYVVRSPTSYWRGDLLPSGEWVWTGVSEWSPTSQGFADGDARMDDVRLSVPGMVCPSTADGLSIGQAGPPDRVRGLHQGVYFTALPGVAFEPHLVSNGQGVWMGCARTPQGAALFSLAPPFVAEDAQQEPPTPPVPPVPVPLPPKPPTPTPPKEPETMQLPNDAMMVNAMRRIHLEGYIGELKRPGGIFETPDDSSQIRDPRPPFPPAGERAKIDDFSLSVWTGRYVAYFAQTTSGDPHEQAIRAVLRDLHNSDEARQKRGETGQPPPATGTLRGPITTSGRDFEVKG